MTREYHRQRPSGFENYCTESAGAGKTGWHWWYALVRKGRNLPLLVTRPRVFQSDVVDSMLIENVLEDALTRGRLSALQAVDDPAGRQRCLQALRQLQQQELSVSEPLDVLLADHSVAALHRREMNILSLTDQLFSVCAQHSELEPELFNAFLQLKPLVAQILMAEPNLSAAGSAPALLLIDALWRAGGYWGSELGRAADRYSKRLFDMLAQLRTADPATAPFATWLEEITSQVEKDLQRAELLSRRICDSEKGQLLSNSADGVVVAAVNQLLARGLMPEAAEQLLKGAFFQSLKLAFLQGGTDGEPWRQLIHAGELLIDSLQFDGSSSRSAELYQLIPQVPELLKPALISLNTSAERATALEEIDKIHMGFLLEGRIDGLRPASLLAESSALTEDAQVGQQVMAQVDRLSEGQWLVYSRESGESLRCRLAMKLPQGKVIFTNLLGAKCLEKNMAELAYLLSAQQIRLLDQERSFVALLEDVFEQITQLFQRQLMLHTEQQNRRQREQALREQAQLKAKQEAEQLAQAEREQQLAREREAQAQAERERLAREQREREAAEAAEAARAAQARAELAEQQAQQQALLEARQAEERARQAEQAAQRQAELAGQQELLAACAQQVDTLVSGAWLDLLQDGQWLRVKLAAILPSSDKFILAGRDGKKLAEPKRSELTEWLASDLVRVIDGGAQFENSLAKVIQTLRSE